MTIQQYDIVRRICGTGGCLALALMLFCGCSRQNDDTQDDTPFKIGVSMDNPTRVTFIDYDIITDYDIDISAYSAGTMYKYFENAWCTYTEGAWRFVSESSYETYVWPRGFALDFISTMPRDLENTYTGVSDIAYVASGDAEPCLTFSCTVPMREHDDASGDALGQESLTEFMYAVDADRLPSDEADGVGYGAVTLHFRHPLSKVSLWLNKALRCTIDEIEIKGVYASGSFCMPLSDVAEGGRGTWTTDGGTDKLMNIAVGKKIPEDVNNNSRLAGPFLMIPQTLTTDAIISVKYTPTPQPGQEGEQKVSEAHLVIDDSTVQWEPGKEYIYVLTIGDADNEIVLSVQVIDWIPEGATSIDVE